MSSDLSLDRVRAWLRSLSLLTAERGRGETEIEQRHRTDRDATQSEREKALERIERRDRIETTTAKAKYREVEKKVTTKFNHEDERVRRAELAEREQITEKGQHSDEAARRRWDEAVWAAETVYEAKENQPGEAYRETCKTLDTVRAELDTMETSAATLLARSRMRLHAEPVEAGPDGELAGDLEQHVAEAGYAAERLNTLRRLRLFQDIVPFVLALLPAGGVAIAIGLTRGWQPVDLVIGGAAGALVVTIAFMAWMYATTRAEAAARHRTLRDALHRAIGAHDAGRREGEAARIREEAELVETRDREISEARTTYEPIIEQIQQRRVAHFRRIDEKYPAMMKQLRRNYDDDIAANRAAWERQAAESGQTRDDDRAKLEAASLQRLEMIEACFHREWSAMQDAWLDGVAALRKEAARLDEQSARYFPDWTDDLWHNWIPGETFAPAIRFGRIDADMASLPGGLPTDERLLIGEPTRFTVPALLSFPDHCSMLLETPPGGRDQAVQTLQTIMMRLLTTIPPGKVRFTILDPVGLGRNFAGFMHLADYNEAFVGGKIWTETRHIEQQLADLTEHMENVIQKYLRNEYETIAQYNAAAGEIAEPYRFVVVSDFPTNFSEAAAKRLVSVLSSGPRCGVYTLIAMDSRLDLPRGTDRADLRQYTVNLAFERDRFLWKDPDLETLPLSLDPPPGEEFVTEILKRVGENALDATRVEVPFEVVTPPDDELWSRSATADLRVPLGRAGATRLQNLTLGHGTNQHVLIAGKTGSGKSTLLHVLITNLSLWYSPDEVEFYLVDFKKGVEFKTYAMRDLPHARAIAIESDREFGLSVLHRLDDELKRRGELFRKLGVQDLAGYRRADDRPMPRVMLIIDEFQEFFIEDDKIGQDAALLLDRLVRQGRAFGMHVLLGSQTLGGAYTLARSTLGQMGVRIALQCSETDSYLILSDDNAAARLLSRPGEAIYNDANGQVQGNSPFQAVWLPDDIRDQYLAAVQEIARDRNFQPPEPQIVFEGNVPADITANHLLEDALRRPGWARHGPAQAWFGEAVAIKDPTSVRFTRTSGGNTLIVGQREDAALAVMTVSLIALAAQCDPARSRFVVLDGIPTDSPYAGRLERAAATMPHDVHVTPWREVPASIASAHAELRRRIDSGETDGPELFMLVNGIQRFRMLRRSENDFSFSMSDEEKAPSPDAQFAELVREGPVHGIHLLIWCDTVTNLERVFDRQTLREFDNRVLFQMGAPDSTTLIDTPAASKLGLQRALLANEEHGTLEKFRPYGIPPDEWLAEAGRMLADKSGGAVEVNVVARAADDEATVPRPPAR